MRTGPNAKKTNHKPYWVNEWGTVNETTNKQAKEQTYIHNNNDRLHFILTGQRFCSVVFLVTSWVIDVVLQTGEKRNLNISGLKKPVHLYIPQNSGNGSPADVTKNTVQYFVKPSYNIYESKLIQYHKINIPKATSKWVRRLEIPQNACLGSSVKYKYLCHAIENAGNRNATFLVDGKNNEQN